MSGPPGAYSFVPFRVGGYYFGSVDQERYGAIAMRLRALGYASGTRSPGLENAGI